MLLGWYYCNTAGVFLPAIHEHVHVEMAYSLSSLSPSFPPTPIAKDVVLAGVKSVTIHDPDTVETKHLSSQVVTMDTSHHSATVLPYCAGTM